MTGVETQKAVVQDAPKQWPSLGLGEALTLALITTAAYVGAFGYEAAICTHFGIPTAMVRISAEVLISSLLPVLGFAVVLVLWLEPLTFPFVSREERRSRVTRLFFILQAAAVAIVITFFLAFGFSWQGLRTFLFLLLLIDCALAVFAFFALAWRKWGIRNWPRVNTAIIEAVQTTPKPFIVVSRYVDFRHVATILFLPLCLTIGALAGFRNARVWDRFFVIKPKALIIVRQYGDVHICKPLGKAPDTIGSATIVLTTADMSNVPITPHKFPRPPRLETE